MKREKTINASSIKNKEQWRKAMESGARIVFNGGYPTAPKKSKKN